MKVSKISDETKQVILQAAIAEIAEVGITHLRTQNIAKRAGVASGLLHYHYKTKENMLFEIAGLFSGSELINDLIITPFGRKCSTLEKIQAVIYSLLELPFRKRSENFNGFYHQMFAEGDEFIRKFLSRYDFFAEKYITFIIKEGVKEKVFDIMHPEYFSLIFHNTIINNYSIHKIFEGSDAEKNFFPDPYPESFKQYITDSSMKTLMSSEKFTGLKPLPDDLKDIINIYIDSLSKKTMIISPLLMMKILSKIFNDGFQIREDNLKK